jgi:hypothetical protein
MNLPQLVSELKRRNVRKVAAGYAVGAKAAVALK